MQRIIMIAAVLLAGVNSSGWAKQQVFESLYSFPASGEEGERPSATLTVGQDGKIYGTTIQGGAFDAGTAFRISTEGEVEIFSHFNPATTGMDPVSRLLNFGDGYLYGVTNRNAVLNGSKAGTLYRLDPSAPASEGLERGLTPVFQVPGSGYTTPMKARALAMAEPNVIHVLCEGYGGIWRVPLDNPLAATVSYFFQPEAVDGSLPYSLTAGWDGFLYGTTRGSGHAAAGTNVRGTIFRIAPDGTGMTRLHECQIESGTAPFGGMVQGPDGNFYGMMSSTGGTGAEGVLYRISGLDGQYTVIHRFKDLRDPRSDLMIGTDGYIYGTASRGGANNNGSGGVYRIRLNGTGYKILHTFNGQDGQAPVGGLVQGPDGNIYGTTWQGGTGSAGTIFRLNVKLPELAENRPPVALDDFASSTGEPVLIDARSNDFDPDEDPLLVTITEAPAHGTAVMQPGGLILYTPSGTYAGEDEFTYTATDGRSGETSATVRIRNITPGPLVQVGSYVGVMNVDPDATFEGNTPSGQINLKVTKNGKFTGTLLTQRKRLNLRGAFSSEGAATVNVKLPGFGSATLFLAFQNGETSSIAGVLYGAELHTAVVHPTRTNDAPKKQSYTVLIEADSNLADGFGYGAMSILPNGQVTVKGKLGDGSTLSWSSSLVTLPDGDQAIPLFCEPLRGGFCGGKLVPDSEEPGGFEGSVRWKRPQANKPPYASGFDGVVQIIASPFIPPGSKEPVMTLSSTPVILSGGELTESIEGTVTLEGKKVSVSSEFRSLSFSRSNGTFTGKVKIGKKTVTFSGAVMQENNTALGQFSINGVTGSVEISPPRPAIRVDENLK